MINTFSSSFAKLRAKGNLSSIVDHTAIPYLILTGIVLVGAGMRFYKLGTWSFWIDEVYEIGYAQEALRNLAFPMRLSLPLTGITLNLLGVSEQSARLAPMLLGILTLPVLFFPVRRVFGTAIALLAIFFVAVSPWHLYWSQNARFYTALLLLYSLAQLAFFQWLETDRPGYLVLSGGLLILAVLERLMALFFVPVVLAYFLALMALRFEKPAGLRWRNLMLLGVPAALFGFYQLVTLGNLDDFSTFILGREHNPVRVLLSVIYDLTLPMFLLALAGGVYLVLKKSRVGLYFFLGAVIPVALLVMVAPFAQTFSRYIFMTLPGWAILAAVAVKELFMQAEKHTKILALGVFLLLVGQSFSDDVLYYTYQNGNRPDWKGAYATISSERTPGDHVVTTRPQIGEYYLGQEVIWTQGLNPREVIASGQRTWFVIDNRTGFISPKLQDWIFNETRLVDVRDVSLPGKTLEMRVYLYDPGEQ